MCRILLIFALLASGQAIAHEWFTDRYNPVTGVHCCSGADCVVIPDEAWWQEGKDIKVRWMDGKVYSMPLAQALPSEDKQGRAAACVWGGQLRCFFLPVTG